MAMTGPPGGAASRTRKALLSEGDCDGQTAMNMQMDGSAPLTWALKEHGER